MLRRVANRHLIRPHDSCARESALTKQPQLIALDDSSFGALRLNASMEAFVAAFGLPIMRDGPILRRGNPIVSTPRKLFGRAGPRQRRKLLGWSMRRIPPCYSKVRWVNYCPEFLIQHSREL